jgi:hypothetical protein
MATECPLVKCEFSERVLAGKRVVVFGVKSSLCLGFSGLICGLIFPSYNYLPA